MYSHLHNMPKILKTMKLAPMLLQLTRQLVMQPETQQNQETQGKQKGDNQGLHQTQDAVQVETHPQKLISKLDFH